MSKYTAEQVEAEIANYAEEAFPREEIDLERVTEMLRDYATLLRERESAGKCRECGGYGYNWLAGAPAHPDNQLKCVACNGIGSSESAKAAVTQDVLDIAQAAFNSTDGTSWKDSLQAALEAVAPMLASADIPNELDLLNFELIEVTEERDHLRKMLASARVPDEYADAFKDVLASLVATVSLLRRGGRKAAASDKMFNVMLNDYEKSIARGRDALLAAAPKPETEE